jgi:hypothetical protein
MLYTMFPLASIHPSLTHPLTPNEFYQRILIPQVGLLLIREDLNVSTENALNTMRDSVAYGVAMFPVDSDLEAPGSEWDGEVLREDRLGIADKIMLERARKRRVELDAEEGEGQKVSKKQQQAKGEAKQTGKDMH